MKKVAFFVDWDNLRRIIQNIKNRARRTSTPFDSFDFNNPKHISKLFKVFLDEEKEEYYRIFFYTAKPLKDNEIKDQLRSEGKKRSYQEYLDNIGVEDRIYNLAKNFLDEMVNEDFIALRTGKMQVRGVHNDGRPDIVQKQVDMLIGLDISEVSYNKHADKIVVFSKDTDMIPALKTARINGLEVNIANFNENNHIANDIKVHSDRIITKSFEELNASV
ncbi:MAG: NYN domain-containing protein [Sulfurimonas sp.]|uniref:NYN domain-containing protein n=1 Tax=Sulfurimonas sp. TaxID=2022749 RepID=UPI0025EE3C06|nr:NYN domain-containing protein [Sulfurimonas sp.]MCK9490740.1 NYN domain-containing protein [Sulfurimonas sp.]